MDLIQIVVDHHKSSIEAHHHGHVHHHTPTSTFTTSAPSLQLHTMASLQRALASLPSDCIYRIKGLVRLASAESPPSEATYILNYAFGRHELIPLLDSTHGEEQHMVVAKLTVMGSGLPTVMGKLKDAFRVREGLDLCELIEAIS